MVHRGLDANCGRSGVILMRWIGILLAAVIGTANAQTAFTVPPTATAPTCAGDLTGTFPTCNVAKINGSTPATVATSGSAADLTGTLATARMPAYSGDCSSSSGTASLSCIPKRAVSTVALLPACTAGIRGQMNMVTDALLPVALATVAAGGAVIIGVTCNGTAWVVQ